MTILNNPETEKDKANKFEYQQFVSSLENIETVGYVNVYNKIWSYNKICLLKKEYDEECGKLYVVKLCTNKNGEKFILRERIYVEDGLPGQYLDLWVDCMFYDIGVDNEFYIEKMIRDLLVPTLEVQYKSKYDYLYSLDPYGCNGDARSTLKYVEKHEAEHGPIQIDWRGELEE